MAWICQTDPMRCPCFRSTEAYQGRLTALLIRVLLLLHMLPRLKSSTRIGTARPGRHSPSLPPRQTGPFQPRDAASMFPCFLSSYPPVLARGEVLAVRPPP